MTMAPSGSDREQETPADVDPHEAALPTVIRVRSTNKHLWLDEPLHLGEGPGVW